MAQLNDTLINGDLRVNGNIYGIITSAQSASSAATLTNTAIQVASATSSNNTVSAYVSNNDNSDAYYGPIWANVATGTAGLRTTTAKFSFNPASGILRVTTVQSTNITATTFSGNLSGSATSALTSKSALSAGSAALAASATSALSAGSAQKSYSSYWSKAGDDADTDRIIGLGVLAGTAYWTAGNEFYGTVTYDTAFTFNSKSNTMKVPTLSATNITAATTVRGTNLSGTNISGATKTMTIDNLISSATRTIPTVNNKTITITTGASPATASFSTNTAADKTITLGSMALKASGDYIPTSWSGATASLFSGKASSAVSASGAGSATKAVNDNYGNAINASSYLPKSWSGATASLFSGKAVSAESASKAAKGVWREKSDNQEYKMAFSLNGEFNYNTNYTYNPSLQRLTIPSAGKIGGCTLQWNAGTSALDFNF